MQGLLLAQCKLSGEATRVKLSEMPKPHEMSQYRRHNIEQRHEAFLR